MPTPDVDEEQSISENFLRSLLELEDVEVVGDGDGDGDDDDDIIVATSQVDLPRPASPPPARQRVGAGSATKRTNARDPSPNVDRTQKQRRHPSDRPRRRKLDWPTCLASAVEHADDHDDDDDEIYPDDESPTILRRHDGDGDRVGSTSRSSCSRRNISSMMSLPQSAKTLALAMLAALALAFAEYRTAHSSLSSAVVDFANVSPTSTFDSGNYDTNSHNHRTAVVGGHQARSQVPIPIEYSNFVELAEFADAVAALRAHRHDTQNHHAMHQQEQQHEDRTRSQHGLEGERRDDANLGNSNGLHQEEQNDNDGDSIQDVDENNMIEKVAEKVNTVDRGEEDNEELNEMNNAMEKSWKDAIEKTNPEMKSQRQRQPGLLKVRVPFYWHVPRAGGATLSTLIGACHSLVQATSSLTSPPVFARKRDGDGVLSSRFRDPTLYVVRAGGQLFVNVDLDGVDGVVRASNGKLIEGGLADIVAVSDVRLGSILLDFQNRDGDGHRNQPQPQRQRQQQPPQQTQGVMFALFRHPIDRAVSLFYCKKHDKDSVHYDPLLETLSLEDWVVSPSFIPDYMVRTLVGKIWPPAPLVQVDLDVAKEILRRKCVIGLLGEKGESMKRFERFFGWDVDVSRDHNDVIEQQAAPEASRWKNVKDEECRDRLLYWGWINKNKHPTVEEGSTVYRLLESKNRYDIQLYMYARQLFDEQYMQLGFDEDMT